MPSKPIWRYREDALVLGGPLAVLPVLAVVPVTISFFVDPLFRLAPLLGILLLPVLFACEWAGLLRLALVFRRQFDVLTFFALGLMVAFWVFCVCSGVLLAIVLGEL